MAESYSFFNSKDHDRRYNAKHWADYFFPLFRSGVFNGDLQVVADEGMHIAVNPGYAWIDGYGYHLWDEIQLDLETASGNMNRTDSIVIRLDLTNRMIGIFCKTGSYYAGTPVPPAPAVSATVHELVIAHIFVKSGTTKITQDMITDTRMDKAICGWVCGAVEQIDFTQITAQFEQFFANYRKEILDAFNKFMTNANEYDEEFVSWIAEKKDEILVWKDKEAEEVDKWQADEKAEVDIWLKKEADALTAWIEDFENRWDSWLLGETKGWQEEIIDWFNNLKERLTENAAVQLQLQIGDLNKLETDAKDDLVSAINSLALTYDETMAILAGTKTVTVTLSANDGASVEGQTVTLHNVATGENRVMQYSGEGITFTVAGGLEYRITVENLELHTTPDPMEIIIIEEEFLELNLEYKIMALGELSWDGISSLSAGGKAGAVFNIHDTKEITLTTGEKVVLEIVGFDHDILTEDESRKAGITFGTKNCLTQYYSMNPSEEIRAGGWETSEMRTVHIREHFYNVLPEDLKAVIKRVNKNSFGVGKAGLNNMQVRNIETTADDVWLFSETELGGKRYAGGVLDTREGEPYPGLTDGDTYGSARKKYRGMSGEEAAYFTRSIDHNTNTGFKCIWEDGKLLYTLQYEEYGMAVGFCI